MQIELIYQSHHEELSEFKKKTIKSKWDSLILVAEGEYFIRPNVKQKPTVLKKNEIAFIPADLEFDRSVKAPVTYYHISFYPQKDHPFYITASLGKLRLPTKQVEAILESLRCASMLPDNRELITHIVERIFAENYLFGSRDKAKLKPFSEEIESAIRYMRSNLDQRIDMDELAAHVFLSHSGLIWKFKNELNTTPSNYLIILRLQHAKQLLLNYSYNITEISEMCGYQSPYYFTKAFHRHVGMSPTQFRKYHLKKQ